MSGKWILIALLTSVAMFGLGGLQKHKWKVRLALIGVAMGLTPLHKDLINALGTSVVFGVVFFVIGVAIDLIIGKFFHKKDKSVIEEQVKEQKEDRSATEAISGFDLENVKKIAKSKATRTKE